MSAEPQPDAVKPEASKKLDEAPDPDKTLAEQVSQNEMEMYKRTQEFMSEIEEEAS